MTKAYSEAVRDQPTGCYLVPCATFIHVARNFGFDRWKVGVSCACMSDRQQTSSIELVLGVLRKQLISPLSDWFQNGVRSEIWCS